MKNETRGNWVGRLLHVYAVLVVIAGAITGASCFHRELPANFWANNAVVGMIYLVIGVAVGGFLGLGVSLPLWVLHVLVGDIHGINLKLYEGKRHGKEKKQSGE